MPVLIIGLILFLGIHSVRIYADDWRSRCMARWGDNAWKGLYSLVSLLGLVLIVWGFSQARPAPILLYVPPAWLRHVNALFMLASLLCLAAAYVPRNHIKAWLGHPMLVGVKLWAFGHLLVNGMLHEVLLFGAFLLWAIVLFAVSRRRDRRNGTNKHAGSLVGDVLTVLAALLGWALFAFVLHAWLFGVQPTF